MIDLFSLGLCHGLLLLTAWRLLQRPDLDRETDAAPASTAAPAPVKPQAWGRPRA